MYMQHSPSRNKYSCFNTALRFALAGFFSFVAAGKFHNIRRPFGDISMPS